MRFRLLICATFMLPMMHNLPVVAGPATQAATTLPVPQWGDAVNGLQLSVSSSKSVYAPDDSIALLIGIRNVTKNPIIIAKTLDIGYYYKPIVFLPDDKVEKATPAPLTLRGQEWMRDSGGAFQIWDEELQPGQEIYEKCNDVQLAFDMTLDGEYPIYIIRKFVHFKDENNKVELRSNTITIKINSIIIIPTSVDDPSQQAKSETGK